MVFAIVVMAKGEPAMCMIASQKQTLMAMTPTIEHFSIASASLLNFRPADF